ncbi:MAG TPA: tryptophan--tRNA ligase [Candidatus Saccharimonadales bacterium]|nr:tryptophan--tRNA ligase [Candidatus Saccharimonadales bacterium]
MQKVLTGLRANDELTIGNYLGGIEPMVRMVNKLSRKYKFQMFLPDLHSFTTPIDHSKLYDSVMKNIRMFVAAGVPIEDPDFNLYRQSRIPAHSELCVILNNLTSYGVLTRMVEFKDKASRGDTEFVSVGLFDYPVLMAADILLYGPTYVPLGDDQRQHVELTRDIAERFNNKFGEIFVIPAPIQEQARFVGQQEQVRIMSLTNPEKKMSKSVKDPNGTILLSDDPKAAAKKIMSATTDSVGKINFDKVNQPGITNLLVLLALLEGRPQEDINQEFVGQTQYGELKKRVANAVEKTLTELQEAYKNVDETKLKEKLEESEEQMREIANQTLLKVQKAVGLRQ